MEKYSILMSVYHGDNPEYLKQAISSMIFQTIPSDDFVIVEDGPLNDALYKVLGEFSYAYPEIIRRIKNTENKGLAYSLNKGLEKCKNRLVARMDADDISDSRRCEKQLRMFCEDSNLVIVGTAMAEFMDSCEKIKSVKLMPELSSDIVMYAKRRSPFNHPSVMYDKEIILNKFNGYNIENKRAEDFELFTSIVFNGYKCANINEFLLFYRTDSAQIKRRFSVTSFKGVIHTEFKNFKNKFVGVKDLLYVFCAQTFGLICPDVLLQYLMKKYFRQ